jgi:TatD DNase family protein
MSRSLERGSVDCHAHVAPDVTSAQLAALGNSTVFAVTRSLDEARLVARRRDPNVLWGVGIHPGVASALSAYDPPTFERALAQFALVGEVGLDRRGSQTEQKRIFSSVLERCSGHPVLISIHSTGRTRETLDCLAKHPHPGAILHWFNGTPDEIAEAVDMGCHFSVNAAMDPYVVRRIPTHRLLTETDFPSSRRRTQASKPGDTHAIETLLRTTHDLGEPVHTVRANLNQILETSKATSRMPEALGKRLAHG